MVGNRSSGFGQFGGRGSISGRLILGLIVMTLGVLWTLDNLDLVESEPLLQWWPAVIIAIGVAKLTGVGTRRHTAWGVVFTLAGTWLLVGEIGLLDIGLEDIWPLILVVLGVHLLTRSRNAQTPAGDDPSAVVHTFAVWSGIDRKVVSQAFQGGDITAVMGGVELDLRQAKPVEGHAVLDLFVWWGGVDIQVPEHWKVVNEANVLMGGIEDSSKAPSPDTRETLILRGLVVMGGVEIKN